MRIEQETSKGGMEKKKPLYLAPFAPIIHFHHWKKWSKVPPDGYQKFGNRNDFRSENAARIM